MKRENKRNIIIVCIIVFSICIISVFVNSATKVSAENEYEYKVNFTKKGYFKEMGNNWIYFFDILEYDKSKDFYAFDGYNMRDMYVEGYSKKMINPETQEIVQKTTSEMPVLMWSDENETEIKRINDYFNEKQYSRLINILDLNDLDTSFISKSLLVEMYNAAYNSKKMDKPGKFIKYSQFDKTIIDSTDNDRPGKWEITYINDYGYLKYVTIDLVLDDKTFLSNIDDYSSKLKKIEQKIEDKQTLDGISLDEFSEKERKDLGKLLTEASKKISN